MKGGYRYIFMTRPQVEHGDRGQSSHMSFREHHVQVEPNRRGLEMNHCVHVSTTDRPPYGNKKYLTSKSYFGQLHTSDSLGKEIDTSTGWKASRKELVLVSIPHERKRTLL
jgi:hypothetical protein